MDRLQDPEFRLPGGPDLAARGTFPEVGPEVAATAASARRRVFRRRWGAAGLALAGLGTVFALLQLAQESGPSLLPLPSVAAKVVNGNLRDPAVLRGDVSRGVSPAVLRDRQARQSSADEARLLDVYGLLASGDNDGALAVAQQLVAQAPGFGLGQLVYGDLLNAQVNGEGGFADVPVRFAEQAHERLRELKAEARARVHAAAFAPPAGMVPAAFVSLAPDVAHAIAVDVTRSRVYVIKNTAQGPTLIREYYASIGKQGISKFSAGDQRTPLGVYFVTRQVPPTSLPARYGTRALVLNYPNPYDKLEGRGGDGIWLHGVPAIDYTRAPWATDGCVALGNAYMEELTGFIDFQNTPIVIAENLEWAAPADLRERHAAFLSTFDQWRSVRDAADASAQLAFYSTAIQVPEGSAASPAWQQRLRESRESRKGVRAAAIDRLSVVHWQEKETLMVVTFTEGEPNVASAKTRRQYWIREGQQWRIFYERVLG